MDLNLSLRGWFGRENQEIVTFLALSLDYQDFF